LLGNKKCQKIIVGIVHGHPQYNIVEFSPSFSETIAKITEHNCAHYVLGDININLLNVPNDSRAQQYVDCR